MRECWRETPTQRPSFTMLRSEFAQRLPAEMMDSDTIVEEDIAVQNATNHLQDEVMLPLPSRIEERLPLRV